MRAAAIAAALLVTAQAMPAHAATTKVKPAFPVTVSSAGFTTTVKQRPKRIISLSPSGTEDFYGVGAGKQVLAVDDVSNYPKGAPMTKLSAYSPNVEAVAAMKPDLVLLSVDAVKALDVRKGLVALGIPVLMERAPADMNGAYAEILTIGAVTGHAAQAKALVTRMEAQIAGIVKSMRVKAAYRAFFELDNTLYSATSKTFIGQVLKSIDPSIVNIADAAAGADSSGYPQLSAEYLLSSDPQVVFLNDAQYGESVGSFGSRAGYSTMSAVKTGDVIELPADIPSRWGPRLVDLYRIIGTALTRVG